MTELKMCIALCDIEGSKYHAPTAEEIQSGSYYQYQPNLTLDWLHELEKKLPKDRVDAFAAQLAALVGNRQIDRGSMRINTEVNILFATKYQRAEALLRTLGKWKNSDSL